MTLTPQWLDELRARTALSAVIGRTVRVQKAGREFKACCPFHDEKTPSFTINDEKGFYHCFGCGAHGDVIRWMTDKRGLSFMDAVKELAAEASLEVPALDPRAAKVAEQRQSLHDVMAAAQAWFVANLKGDGGAEARAYLARRGFDAATIERFGFGLAPGGRQALKQALAFPEEMLIEAGLRITVEGKEPYDRFRGRLMLPIQDPRGRIVGFGGRILDGSASDAPKYLNSPDTTLFDKGRTLYNLNRAGPAARQSGRLIVVEGYMDVIALAAAGFAECVAPMGTALTETQIELLWRLVETPVLCFDGDAAGQRAAQRAILRALPMLRPAHSLAILTLPPGLDPDDLVKQQGPDAFAALLGQARSLVDVLWDQECAAAPLTTPEDKAGLKARLVAHIETIGDGDIKALYRRELLARFSALAFPPRPERPPFVRGAPQGRRVPTQPRQLPRNDTAELLTSAVLIGFTRFPAALSAHSDALARLETADPLSARLRDCLIDLAESGQALDCAAIATILAGRKVPLPTPPALSQLRLVFLDPAGEESEAIRELGEAVALLVERPAIEGALRAATERFGADPEGAFAEQQRLLKRKLAFERRLLQMAAAKAAADLESNG